MQYAVPTTTDVVKPSADNNNSSSSRRGIAQLLLFLISLLSLLRASSTISKFYTENTSSSHHLTSETFNISIYLIDTSNLNHTNIAVSTWGNIAPHWNRTTEYSNLMNLATTTTESSLPIDNIKQQQQPKIMVIIHCGPKVGSTTLRFACRNNLQRTCPQIDLVGREKNNRVGAPPGYFGGIGKDNTRLISVMKECVDTYYFCVKQITVLDMLARSLLTW